MDKPSWRPAYVGLGSNLEEPRTQVLRALERIRELPHTRLVLASPLYRSRPMGPASQPDFVNAVAALLTQLEARALLDGLLELEALQGRPPVHEHWGPRVIDLDLLAYAREERSDPVLRLPHPGIPARNFVLYPLADIAPDLDLPGLGRVAELAGRVSTEGLTRL
ncbi:MAG TPA: 2-amino-4-hydroxy-6-hydroxymethyldihydropteridine diphosphokinase [Steroidobacteraceae bacterium]|jgi:2-amino-4-hydroxy-6-hydroxymethyldihydropteridine diphosphokinase|nr:2-amino-4-hydroxy-6-hydroxymethyldihydropteridine diphosphokinase [Steroidobacteraceae bacterium]